MTGDEVIELLRYDDSPLWRQVFEKAMDASCHDWLPEEAKFTKQSLSNARHLVADLLETRVRQVGRMKATPRSNANDHRDGIQAESR